MTDEVKTSEDAAKLLTERSVGELAEKLGIKILELSAERSVATMPVEGNTQPFGVLHGGIHNQ
jgi:acyl-coenzyme A thioesterase PaaI-like protein